MIATSHQPYASTRNVVPPSSPGFSVALVAIPYGEHLRRFDATSTSILFLLVDQCLIAHLLERSITIEHIRTYVERVHYRRDRVCEPVGTPGGPTPPKGTHLVKVDRVQSRPAGHAATAVCTCVCIDHWSSTSTSSIASAALAVRSRALHSSHPFLPE